MAHRWVAADGDLGGDERVRGRPEHNQRQLALVQVQRAAAKRREPQIFAPNVPTTSSRPSVPPLRFVAPLALTARQCSVLGSGGIPRCQLRLHQEFHLCTQGKKHELIKRIEQYIAPSEYTTSVKTFATDVVAHGGCRCRRVSSTQGRMSARLVL